MLLVHGEQQQRYAPSIYGPATSITRARSERRYVRPTVTVRLAQHSAPLTYWTVLECSGANDLVINLRHHDRGGQNRALQQFLTCVFYKQGNRGNVTLACLRADGSRPGWLKCALDYDLLADA